MASRDDWKGRLGAEWAARGAALAPLLDPPAAAGLARLGLAPGQSVIDLGCGAGPSTRALCDAVGAGGRVLGIDISPDLVRAAREHLAGRSGVSVIEADAASHVFDGERFDALYSRFGAMFFDDPGAAFSNLRSALVPAGRAVFVAWRPMAENAWAALPLSALGVDMPPVSDPPPPGPFAWARRDVFEPALEAGGFHNIQAEAFSFEAPVSDGAHGDPVERALSFFERIGPSASRLRDLPTEDREAAREAIKRDLRPFVRGEAVWLPAAAWIICAEA